MGEVEEEVGLGVGELNELGQLRLDRVRDEDEREDDAARQIAQTERQHTRRFEILSSSMSRDPVVDVALAQCTRRKRASRRLEAYRERSESLSIRSIPFRNTLASLVLRHD